MLDYEYDNSNDAQNDENTQETKSTKGLSVLVNVARRYSYLTWISCKDSRKGSSEKNIRSNFIVLSSLKCKIEHFKPYLMNLVPGVFDIQHTLFM